MDEIVKTRADELAALADTVQILNDDDAKNFPVQLQASRKIKVSATALRTHALVQLQKLAKAIRPGNARLDLIMLALKVNKTGFEKLIKMIDDLTATFED